MLCLGNGHLIFICDSILHGLDIMRKDVRERVSAAISYTLHHEVDILHTFKTMIPDIWIPL